MPRLVTHTATAPSEVKTKSGDSVWICRCGLTTNDDGTCNGNHRKRKVAEEDAGTLYVYDETGGRFEVEEDDCCCTDLDDNEDDDDDDKVEKTGCCGNCGGCCREEK